MAELQRGLISGLGWLSFSKIEADLNDMLASELPEIRCIAIAAFAAHRSDPGESFTQALSDPDARLRSTSTRSFWRTRESWILPLVLESISDQDGMCRFFAAWSAARIGDRSQQVVQTLQEIALGDSEYSEPALDIVLRIMSVHEAKSWYHHLKKEPVNCVPQ